MNHRQVWKFPIEPERLTDFEVELQMPVGAEILHVADQGGILCLWAMVETANVLEPRFVRVYGTGHDARCRYEQRHLGTVLMDGLVWHVFEVIR